MHKYYPSFWMRPFVFTKRIFYAVTYFNKKYPQILKWGIKSNEDTNFTYDLTEENILSLAQLISVVTKTEAKQVLSYIDEARNDQLLRDSIDFTIKNSALKATADPGARFGRRLGWYAIVRILKPRVVVETGVDKGLGSALLCTALKRNSEEGNHGKYYGTDINPKAGILLTDKYKDTGKILYGDSIKSLSRFSEEIDLFINDSDHSANYEYDEYQTIKNKLSPTAIILGDNSHISDKLSKFSAENGRSYLYFHEHPLNHWYPGAGIGISFVQPTAEVATPSFQHSKSKKKLTAAVDAEY